MGIFDFFRRRRERESAVDLSQLGGYAPVLEQATKSRGAEATPALSSAHALDFRGQEELRDAVLATLRRHGVDAEKGQQVQVTDPHLQQEIFKTLSEHGVDVTAVAGAVASDPAVPMGGEDTVGQLERLQRLREQGTLTDAEFEQQKREILGG
jgi:hypothetical protein